MMTRNNNFTHFLCFRGFFASHRFFFRGFAEPVVRGVLITPSHDGCYCYCSREREAPRPRRHKSSSGICSDRYGGDDGDGYHLRFRLLPPRGRAAGLCDGEQWKDKLLFDRIVLRYKRKREEQSWEKEEKGTTTSRETQRFLSFQARPPLSDLFCSPLSLTLSPPHPRSPTHKNTSTGRPQPPQSQQARLRQDPAPL